MKIVDIRKLPTTELAAEASKLRDDIAEMRRRLQSGELQNNRALRNKRKDLARVLTVLGEQLSKENI